MEKKRERYSSVNRSLRSYFQGCRPHIALTADRRHPTIREMTGGRDHLLKTYCWFPPPISAMKETYYYTKGASIKLLIFDAQNLYPLYLIPTPVKQASPSSGSTKPLLWPYTPQREGVPMPLNLPGQSVGFSGDRLCMIPMLPDSRNGSVS